MIEIEILNKKTLMDNLDGIINLYRHCFDNKLNEESFIWRYIENPLEDLLFIVAKEDEKIVASYSASPCLMMNNGIKYKTAMSLNTMTHPKYRGRGLFIRLANELYEYMSECDYKMIWGFPNNISNRMFNQRLDWKTIYEVPTMVFNVNNKHIIKTKKNIVEDSKFELDYSQICSRGIKDIYVKKSKKYLQWRYTKNPDNNYMQATILNDSVVKAYVVYKEHKDLINIVDINFMGIEDANELIKYIINYAISEKRRAITIWAPINTELHILLEKYGFYNDYPVRYLGARLLSERKENGKNMLSYYNWFINAGDNNEY